MQNNPLKILPERTSFCGKYGADPGRGTRMMVRNSAGLSKQQLAVATTVKARNSVSLPRHLGFSHPKEIHVASQDREMGIRSRC